MNSIYEVRFVTLLLTAPKASEDMICVDTSVPSHTLDVSAYAGHAGRGGKLPVGARERGPTI